MCESFYKPIPLSRLKRGQSAQVVDMGPVSDQDAYALYERGIFPGTILKLYQEAPFLKDPLAVEVRGAVVALRRKDAHAIFVRTLRTNRKHHA